MLEWFNDNSQGISPGELKEIERKIGELMESMSKWFHHSEEREEFIENFTIILENI
ncbi:hypothetical protein AK40_5870 (plasmid) [Bacillus cereus 03BB108]|uniref:Uncharacterized protein n=1 Tax=Bacillus cereus 03BB108 TaxID=451709 RepID=A0AAN0W466_BACCE|nr:hypothetical protein AK40_5870 [Bacillus cereus 03BB108]